MQVGFASSHQLLFLGAVTENDAKYMHFFSLTSDATGSNISYPLVSVSGFPFV